MRIQPNEGISLRFEAKVPGADLRTRTVEMDFSYGSSFGMRTADAYHRLYLIVCWEIKLCLPVLMK